jgi:hypothetical protein
MIQQNSREPFLRSVKTMGFPIRRKNKPMNFGPQRISVIRPCVITANKRDAHERLFKNELEELQHSWDHA